MLARSFKTLLLNFVRRHLFVDTPLEPRLRQLVSGRGAYSWRAKLLPGHDLFKAPSVRVMKNNGQKLELDLSDWMEWAAYFELRDPAIEQLKGLLKPGDTALDVGTNIGSMLIAMAQSVGKTGSVYGFEPQKTRFDKCNERIRFEGLSNASLEQLAVGASQMQVEIVSPDARNAGRARVRSKSEKSQAVDQVTCLPLDVWLDGKSIRHVDLVKIDVEGFEMEVLKGMTRLIDLYSPTLFIEIDQANLQLQGSSAQELLQWLRDRRYSFDESQTHTDHYDLIARRA